MRIFNLLLFILFSTEEVAGPAALSFMAGKRGISLGTILLIILFLIGGYLLNRK